jgi:hypothetical protein
MSRYYLYLEFALLYVCIPVLLIFTEDIFPLIPTILIITGGVIIALRRQGWQYRELWVVGPARAWRSMLLVFLGFVVFWIPVAWYFFPEQFLSFPRERPDIWLMVMLLYPLLSAFPQEILYRTFLMERYRTIVDHSAGTFILISGVTFMWGHILFMNAFAISVTLLGGLVFAWRYWQTRSVLLVSVEHALYGNLFFTLGLGQFLFSGMV